MFDIYMIADFKVFTAELAFLIRTFFFVVFGISLSLDTLVGIDVWVISVLLFFAIPEEFKILEFESGVLFVIIIVTSLLMAFSLIVSKRKASNKEVTQVENQNSAPIEKVA